mmetsp:Transcript_65379/g.132986  ORF Transcript_65379/g.132986 Transcript_65379/m.132986 type:complete len:259 (-) Transcript_65379:40-816(-)
MRCVMSRTPELCAAERNATSMSWTRPFNNDDRKGNCFPMFRASVMRPVQGCAGSAPAAPAVATAADPAAGPVAAPTAGPVPTGGAAGPGGAPGDGRSGAPGGITPVGPPGGGAGACTPKRPPPSPSVCRIARATVGSLSILVWVSLSAFTNCIAISLLPPPPGAAWGAVWSCCLLDSGVMFAVAGARSTKRGGNWGGRGGASAGAGAGAVAVAVANAVTTTAMMVVIGVSIDVGIDAGIDAGIATHTTTTNTTATTMG